MRPNRTQPRRLGLTCGGIGSRVKVTDAGLPVIAGPRPAARIDVEDFAFTVNGPYTEVNLSRHQGGWENDLSYDHVTGVLQSVNGAMVADIRHYGAAKNVIGESGLPALILPDENDCARTAPSAWRPRFTAKELRADITVACIITAERDFGYLVIGRNPTARPISYYLYSYVWAR